MAVKAAAEYRTAFQHDPPGGILVGVADVEDVAGVDVNPAHRRAGAVVTHDAQAGAVLVVPSVGHRLAGQFLLEGDRQVEPDDVVLGDREVVHHGAGRDGYRAAVHQLPGGVEAVVGHKRRLSAVAEEVQLARCRVAFGVGRHGGGQPPAEIARAHRIQLGRYLVGEPDLDQCKDAPGMPDHMGVGGHGGQVTGAVGADERAAGESGRACPSVAVPLGAAAAQPDAMQHACADERMSYGFAGQRVGAVAEIPAGKLRRQRAGHRQVDRIDLVRHRCHQGTWITQAGRARGHMIPVSEARNIQVVFTHRVSIVGEVQVRGHGPTPAVWLAG